MSKFIKVTVIEQNDSKAEHRINIESIESFKDGKVLLKHSIELDVMETAEQIEAQLLRDEFAKAALTGFTSKDGTTNPELDSHICYQVADAMLKERSRCNK